MATMRSNNPLDDKAEAIKLHSLRLIYILYRRESLAQAAAILNISTSKASRELADLRKIFGDDLFVRSGARMVPTSKMGELYPRIRTIFEELGSLFDGWCPFDPKTAQGLVRIAVSDNAFTVCVAPFLEDITTRAPHLKIEICSPFEGTPEALRKGEVDLLIAHDPLIKLDGNFHRRPLLESHHAVVMRRGHPLSKLRPDSLHDIADWGMITLPVKLPSGFSQPNPAIVQTVGEAPVECPYFVSSLLLSAESSKVMVCAEVLATHLSTLLPIEFRVLKDAPAWKPELIWHNRTNGTPLLQWIRSLLLDGIRRRYPAFSDAAGSQSF